MYVKAVGYTVNKQNLLIGFTIVLVSLVLPKVAGTNWAWAVLFFFGLLLSQISIKKKMNGWDCDDEMAGQSMMIDTTKRWNETVLPLSLIILTSALGTIAYCLAVF